MADKYGGTQEGARYMNIALAYAMGSEIESMLQKTGAWLLETIAGTPIYELESSLLAYTGGIGKVNAAMSAQLVIDRYKPDWIINVGVAGSLQDLPIGTVVLASEFVQHDVDTSPMGDPIGLVSTVNRIVFPTDEPEKTGAILDALGVPFRTGRIATGEAFMVKGARTDWVARTFSPLLCEMEGGAIAQVCLRNGVKFTALKSVSDRLCQENNASEYFNFAEAMEHLNQIAVPFARALAKDT